MSDERLKRPTGAERMSRGHDDRARTHDREQSDPVRLQRLLDTFSQAHLNTLPPIPGYHVMWATTTNPRDTVQMRLQAGYELVTEADLPDGYAEGLSIKGGEFAGAIGTNEMIALKLPSDLYEAAMKHFHHDLPAAEDGKLRAIIDMMRELAARNKLTLHEGSGFADV